MNTSVHLTDRHRAGFGVVDSGRDSQNQRKFGIGRALCGALSVTHIAQRRYWNSTIGGRSTHVPVSVNDPSSTIERIFSTPSHKPLEAFNETLVWSDSFPLSACWQRPGVTRPPARRAGPITDSGVHRKPDLMPIERLGLVRRCRHRRPLRERSAVRRTAAAVPPGVHRHRPVGKIQNTGGFNWLRKVR